MWTVSSSNVDGYEYEVKEWFIDDFGTSRLFSFENGKSEYTNDH